MKSNLIGKSLFLLFALLLLPMAAMSQTITVKGVVTDNAGQPLPGVNVVVEGTTNGTITDVNGNYSVQASSDATLVFSFIGFESTTEAIQGRTQISVSKSSPTAEQLAAQSDKYKQVLDIYFSIVPREQQYGVCVWSLSDNENEHEYWLNGETPNLFDAKYNRKHAYKGFCDGLAGRVIGDEFKS